MIAAFTTRAAERALSDYGTRGPDESPACPGECGGDADTYRDDGLCRDCRAEMALDLAAVPPALDVARTHRGAAPVSDTLSRIVHASFARLTALALTAALAADPGYLAWCDAERDAAWEAQDAGMRGEVGCAEGVAS